MTSDRERKKGPEAPVEIRKPTTNVPESEPGAEIKRVEAEVKNAVDLIETAFDPAGELTPDEIEARRSLLRRVFDAPMDLLKLIYRQEMFESARAKHKDLGYFERDFRKRVFTAGEQQKGGDAIGALVKDEPALRDHVARLLLELYRNEDYYDTHGKTEWDVTQLVIRHPYDPHDPQTHEKVSEPKGMYQVFTTVRAKEC